MAQDEIEVGEEIDVAVVTDEDDNVVGAVIDDLVVATGEGGSVVDELVEVLDAEGNPIAIDESIQVYDADGMLVESMEVGAVALED